MDHDHSALGIENEGHKNKGIRSFQNPPFFSFAGVNRRFKPKAQNVMSTAATEHGQAWGEARQPVGTPGSSTR